MAAAAIVATSRALAWTVLGLLLAAPAAAHPGPHAGSSSHVGGGAVAELLHLLLHPSHLGTLLAVLLVAGVALGLRRRHAALSGRPPR